MKKNAADTADKQRLREHLQCVAGDPTQPGGIDLQKMETYLRSLEHLVVDGHRLVSFIGPNGLRYFQMVPVKETDVT